MSNFRFLDDTDAQRLLGVDRITFQELIRTKRLRPISGQGTIQFFRAGDVARLRGELEQELAERQAAAITTAEDGETATARKKKAQDPAMRVHARMTADLRWYDIPDSDIQAWFDQLHPETWARRRANAQFVKERMEQIIALIDAGEARLHAPHAEDAAQ